jgi:hypothetical protein
MMRRAVRNAVSLSCLGKQAQRTRPIVDRFRQHPIGWRVDSSACAHLQIALLMRTMSLIDNSKDRNKNSVVKKAKLHSN